LAEIRELRLDLHCGEVRAGVPFREEEGDDPGPGSGFEYALLRFDAAEVREEDAVEGEAVALCGLGDLHDTGSAEGNGVMGSLQGAFHRTLTKGQEQDKQKPLWDADERG